MHCMCSEHKDFKTPASRHPLQDEMRGVTLMATIVILQIMVWGHYTRWPAS